MMNSLYTTYKLGVRSLQGNPCNDRMDEINKLFAAFLVLLIKKKPEVIEPSINQNQ